MIEIYCVNLGRYISIEGGSSLLRISRDYRDELVVGRALVYTLAVHGAVPRREPAGAKGAS